MVSSERRFQILPTSLSHMEATRSYFQKMQTRIPFVAGLGFFGSRTVGNENEPTSDLDMVLFYRGDQMDPTEDVKVFRQRIESEIGEIMTAREVPFDTRETTGKQSLIFVDVSPTNLVEIANEFTVDVQNYRHIIPDFDPQQEISRVNLVPYSPAAWILSSLFFLGIGEGLYEQREFVLNFFEKHKVGYHYFSKLMETLSFIEREITTDKRRNLPKYRGYPQTIEEARNYFLTR